MPVSLKTTLFAILVTLAVPAFAGENEGANFDPTDFLKEEEFEAAKRRAAEAVDASLVVIGDRSYMKLMTESGTLYVPKEDGQPTWNVSHGVCERSLKPFAVAEALLMASNVRFSDAMHISGTEILDAIRSKCEKKL